jgi:hypothetical protein
MFSWENPENRVAIVQMNAALRHAQLELLSAQCATHQLRLRFATEDIAQFAEQDVLRKAIDTAANLHEYYTSVSKQLLNEELHATASSPNGSDEHVFQAAERVLSYIHEQRERYISRGVELSASQRRMLLPFFSAGILDAVKIVELDGEKVPNPSFYPEAKAMGLLRLPEITHMPSMTFIDLIVFNDKINDRSLFHGLVHAVQFQILGVERYADLFVRAFFRTGSHVMVPLEAHAFVLDSRFTRNRAERFSVEEQIRLWVGEGRY